MNGTTWTPKTTWSQRAAWVIRHATVKANHATRSEAANRRVRELKRLEGWIVERNSREMRRFLGMPAKKEAAK